MQKNILMSRILIGLLSCLLWTTTQAGQPLWTIVPALGSNPTQTVPENGIATIQYTVENQSAKPKRLVIMPQPGLTQAAPCQLASKGQNGSSCTLELVITGSALLESGLHGGPILCQANADGRPNPNQCYRPSGVNSLNITRGSAVGATINTTPPTLNFVAGNTGVVTVSNSITSTEPANNIIAAIPSGSNISVQSTTCGTSLAIGASCTITFTAPTAEGPTIISIRGSNTNTTSVAVMVTSVTLATISVNPTTLNFVENSTGNVTVTNNVGSTVAAANVVATIPGGSNISVQSTTCGASLAIGASCTITFTAPSAEGPTNINISGSNTNTTSVAVTVTPVPIATISVNPATLIFAENSTGNVTVTNNVGSTVAAANVVATIPGGSNISVQSTTCGASLAIGASCTITFASSTTEGPTTVPIAGSNTNTVNVAITVTSQPQISITSPVQQSRVVTVSSVTPLSLVITNNAGSAVNANAITVSNKAACPNLSVDDSNCASVAPGNSCTLALTSSTPYAPCTITVSGSNTANSPTALIAFSYLGGLVFQESGGNGKIAIDVLQGFTSLWTGALADIVGAASVTNGVANTDAIVANSSCSNDTPNCAAQRCRNIGTEWYLPALNELSLVHSVLCSNLAIPCNFGGFSSTFYWSSTQRDIFDALTVNFPSGINTGNYNKSNTTWSVRCIRQF